MLERYATPLTLPMTIDQFWRLPHLVAYKADYREGEAELTYRENVNRARLRVAAREERLPADVVFRRLDVGSSQDALARLFVLAFARVPPLDAMPATTRRNAATTALRNTARGDDGELFLPACFAATEAESGQLIGAAIVCNTTLRAGDWPEVMSPSSVMNLTWLFVAPQAQRKQIASALVDRVVNALAAYEVPWLASYVVDANAPAMLFHWRYGFELLPAPRGRLLEMR